MRSSISFEPYIVKNATANNLGTVGALVEEGTSRLRESGIANARREALSLWSGLTSNSLGDTWLRSAEIPDASDAARFRGAIGRRASGEPGPYIVGRAQFRHLSLAVDPRVLIPRPETEGLVQHVLDWCSEQGDECTVLEIGVGSGCVALSLAVEGRYRRIVGTDVSPGALDVARANRKDIDPPVSVELTEGSIFAPVMRDRFTVIVSNPPYVSRTEFSNLDPSVRLYEPRAALVSDEQGMQHIREICVGARRHLEPNGLMALEIDSRRSVMARSTALDAGFGDARIEPDLFGRPRYLLATNGETT